MDSGFPKPGFQSVPWNLNRDTLYLTSVSAHAHSSPKTSELWLILCIWKVYIPVHGNGFL